VWRTIQEATGGGTGERDADLSGRPAQATDNVDEQGGETQ
jgi:hypothetical protein